MTAPRHSRLIILGSGPAGYSAAVYAARANRKPLLHCRTAAGRPAHDHDRSGQLARRRRRACSVPDLMDRMRRHAERFGVEIVQDQVTKVDLASRPFRLTARRRRIHLRRAHHRDRRLGALSRPRFGNRIPRTRRIRLRDLRRLLLSRSGRRRRRRRQYRGRGSDLPDEHRLARDPDPSPRQAARGGDPAGPAEGAGGQGQDLPRLESRSR